MRRHERASPRSNQSLFVSGPLRVGGGERLLFIRRRSPAADAKTVIHANLDGRHHREATAAVGGSETTQGSRGGGRGGRRRVAKVAKGGVKQRRYQRVRRRGNRRGAWTNPLRKVKRRRHKPVGGRDTTLIGLRRRSRIVRLFRRRRRRHLRPIPHRPTDGLPRAARLSARSSQVDEPGAEPGAHGHAPVDASSAVAN